MVHPFVENCGWRIISHLSMLRKIKLKKTNTPRLGAFSRMVDDKNRLNEGFKGNLQIVSSSSHLKSYSD